jgi:type VI secretion system protein ImpC
MAIQELTSQQESKQIHETESLGNYERLCDLVHVDPVEEKIQLDNFRHVNKMAEVSLNERLTAALSVFLDIASADDSISEKIDKTLLDHYIGKIDQIIGSQLDAVLHHEKFQEVESAWRGLKFLIDRSDFRSNIKVELLDVSKRSLQDDFEDSPETTQSGLYRHIYTQEYDTPGGEPITSMVSNFEFGREAPDVSLLSEIARVASAAHCPFLGSVGSSFFDKNSIEEVPKIQDVTSYMERAEYIRWKSFRDSEDSRYVGLVMPRFLLRHPYGEENPVRGFQYVEDVKREGHENYLWGNATFAFAANMAESFKKHGWTVNIRGPESGGKLENLPIHHYDVGKGKQAKIPTEVIISETQEVAFSDQGFIPLSYYKNSDYACFFSANSTQKPVEYSTIEATANSRINSRLPYIFLVSRISHYLKVLQRENIGSSKTRQELENELNDWLQGLVTKMNNPDEALIATHPLRDAEIKVEEIPENPGYYRVSLFVVPHFQIEGVDVRLSLVAKMPAAKE